MSTSFSQYFGAEEAETLLTIFMSVPSAAKRIWSGFYVLCRAPFGISAS